MSVPIRRRRFAAIALASVVVLGTTAACGDDSDSGDSGSGDGPITLVVDVFGDQGFGYEELYKQYEAEHTNVKIQERGKGLGLGDYNTRLTQQITARSQQTQPLFIHIQIQRNLPPGSKRTGICLENIDQQGIGIFRRSPEK